ncbi:TetR/AcrR family transcriptional regulator [Secundilactobacillus silagei]|uniref:TetR/AcrR family transcriptional regulator n=1 Tax=Secundilactobacillus silagei TaxID=1293415 RepID=UPI0006D29D5B|nr:TetR/AcrR family transcriptional regulator [Secundilactobacillus silagei]
MSATQHAQQIKQDSKQYLTTALFQLLATKDLNDIKVTALVKRAGVSRMAFYRNFDTLEDVILQYFGPKIQSLFNDVILQVPEKQKLGDMTEFFSNPVH